MKIQLLPQGWLPTIFRTLFCKLEGRYKRVAPTRSLSGSSVGWIEWTVTDSECFKGTVFISHQCDLKNHLYIIRPCFSTLSYYPSFFLLQVQKAHPVSFLLKLNN